MMAAAAAAAMMVVETVWPLAGGDTAWSVARLEGGGSEAAAAGASSVRGSELSCTLVVAR